jgi:Tol biopolymer transport system component
MPAFSSDGREVAFAAPVGGNAALRRVRVAGGPVETVCACNASFGIAWAPDGTILFAGPSGPLQRVPSSGGEAEPLTALDASERETAHRLPSLLPDGRTFVYTAIGARGPASSEKAQLKAGRLDADGGTLLAKEGSDGRFSPPGHLVFAREGRLLAAPLDPKALRLTGPPVVVLDAVRHAVRTTNMSLETGAAHVAIAGGGLLAWSPGSVTPPITRTPTWIDRSGRETPVEGAPTDAPVLGLRVSEEGRRVLLTYSYPGYEAEVLDFDRGGRRRVTFRVNPPFAIWGPGRDAVTYAAGPSIVTRRVDAGPDEAETLWEAPTGRRPFVGSWSRDGKLLAFSMSSPATGFDVWLLERGREPRPFAASTFDEASPDISPDGRWLVYVSLASGRSEVFATPLAAGGGSVQISTDGGREPLWSRDGRSVLYWKAVAESPDLVLYRVRVAERGGSLAFGAPERLLTSSASTATPGHGWDVAPDGRLLVRKKMSDAARHAWWDRLLSNRILVDTGGVAHLLADAPHTP